LRKIDLKKEKEFENSKVLDSDVRIHQSKYYVAVSESLKKHKELTLKKINDQIVLEIGCSSGYDSVEYAKHCKKLYACDLSNEAIKEAKSLKINNVEFICCDAHNLPYKNDSVDYVIVNSLLHHLDLNIIFKEIKRVLKTKGHLIFKEPLGTNPFFNIYRYFTPKSRTPDERAFTFKDLKLFSKYFEIKQINFFGFFVLLSAFNFFKPFKSLFIRTDYFLSKTPIKYLFWTITGVSRVR
jgi:SAM-dependent methyltransferase